MINFSDFQKLDIRIGLVKDAVIVEESNKLIKLTVDLGEEYGERTIFAGIKEWYTPEDLIGKKFLFVANLEPRKMMGSESQGMMLAADDNRPLLIEVPNDYKVGTKIR